MTLDSITVVSNGLVNFQVRVSSAGGAIATGNIGTELIRSNPITVAAAGTHQVQVGLTLMPGTYLHQYGLLGWNDGSACTVLRQVAAIPYTAAGVACFGLCSVWLLPRARSAFTTHTSGLFLRVVLGPCRRLRLSPGAAPACYSDSLQCRLQQRHPL